MKQLVATTKLATILNHLSESEKELNISDARSYGKMKQHKTKQNKKQNKKKKNKKLL